MIAAHLFTSEMDGALYDTRAPGWSAAPPVRARYERLTSRLTDLQDVKAALRAGGYTSLGCYPLYFLTRDGAALSFSSVRQQWCAIVAEFLADANTGWRLESVQANYEDSDLYCAHSGERIPSAYAEKD